VSTYEPPFTAWLTIECRDVWCDETEHRVDLALVRGLDLAGGPQLWHAMAPDDFDGHPVIAGDVTCETGGDLPENVCIEWPLRECDGHGPPHAHIVGARPLAHTLS
jgi:hypothetical protein